ncbi:hypothetical protein Patl1_01546 [Pistacia atlantica]|uniref:Uncharacterized protein n=1 Tax=Pistacia atlantica TaxID=434234 RepID=A0ACC1C4U6_9ROSI|nr:hypothetical protein Patl1_01546 [Pistacia atlantica]
MEYFSSFTQSIIELLALLLLYHLWRAKANYRNKCNKKMAVPQPNGAWPLIGHFPLLSASVPVCKTLGAIADKCGPIYSLKLGKHQTLIVSSWEFVKECFTTNDRILATRPNISVGRHIGYDNAIFALAPYGPYWREIRKIATTDLLSSHRLEMLKHVRHSEIETLVKGLKLLCAKNSFNPVEVNMSNLIEHFTFNVNLKLIAGKRFSPRDYGEQGSEAWRIERAIKEAIYLSGVFVAGDVIPWLEWMDFQGHVGSMKRTFKEIDHVLGNWLEEHIQRKLQGESNAERDFMDVLLSKIPEDAVMSGHTRDTVIKATSFILIFTGAESTSVAMTWVLSLLLNYPKVLKAVQEELDNQVGREKWVQESDVKNLKYLQAVVKETFRLYPPGPVTGPREALEDCNIGGYHITKGTRLIVNIWKLHRDPRIWQDANEFQPERFMTTEAETDDKGQQFGYIPFSYGRRSCPGMTAGLTLVHLTVARLLQGFDLATIEGKPVDMQEGLGLALPKLKPLEVAIKPRLNSDLYQCV